MVATIIVGLIILCAVIAAIKSIIKDKKSGKSLQCGCNCANCSGKCH